MVKVSEMEEIFSSIIIKKSFIRLRALLNKILICYSEIHAYAKNIIYILFPYSHGKNSLPQTFSLLLPFCNFYFLGLLHF